MIHYEEPIYRPPSEANSLILQATIGCSTNTCAFCVAYQDKPFRIKQEEELFKEIEWARENLGKIKRVFLADGDALVLSVEKLKRILSRLYDRIQGLERVTIYGSPKNLKRKSLEGLKELKKEGLSMIYYGIESGTDEILKRIEKQATAQDIIDQGKKVKESQIDLSATIILGLGGPRLSTKHAEETAKVLNEIIPKYASALTLMLAPRKPSFEDVIKDSTWRIINPIETLKECRILLENIDAEGITFRSNHASNYISLAGDLQKDKRRMIKEIDDILEKPENKDKIKPEFLRAL